MWSGIIKDMGRGPMVALVLEGRDAITLVRKLVGYFEPLKTEPGLIRGLFGGDSRHKAEEEGRSIRNMVHAADSRGTRPRDSDMARQERHT